MIGHKPTRKPHHLDIVPSLTFKPPARLNPVEIAVDVQLQQHRRMIRRPAGCLGSDPLKSKLGEVEFLDKCVDHPDRIVLADPVFQTLREQRALPAIRAFNKALHPIPPNREGIISRNQMKQCVFTQPGSKADMAAPICDVRYSPADSTGRRNTLPLYLARWNGMHMEGHARTWFTPKPKADPWERWKSGQWLSNVAPELEARERCLRSWLSMEKLLRRHGRSASASSVASTG